jgi:hypothetical protein
VHDHDAGVKATVNRISAGAHHYVAITRKRIAEALDDLDAGEFCDALNSLQEACRSVGPLAHAQSNIGVAGGSDLVRVGDLAVGMELTNVGEITEVEQIECDDPDCAGHVVVRVGGREMTLDPDLEAFVVAAEEAPPE